MVFSTLSGARVGFNRSFASGEVRNTKRAGEEFALVGPIRANSYASRKISTGTGLGSQALWVRAFRKIRSNASSFKRFVDSRFSVRIEFMLVPSCLLVPICY